ncbi:ATP-binding protein [Sporichthya sp.]|uniref:ATP-binding protein n=1 Tax=Sporichthya sp. TaxID=65475 RepID=UPI0018568E80|nr:ATP-binding protein [Sporichthya sp.]MBA3742548.1 ATP-binding protein [Sporichthya sp.]
MECLTSPRRIELRCTPEAGKTARDFLDESYCNCHDGRVCEDAALLVSELVTNAVRHGAPPIVLEVRCGGAQTLEVRVRDGGPGQPLLGNLADLDREGGRGVALIDLLSEAWGTETDPSGKTVWFRLNVDSPTKI